MSMLRQLQSFDFYRKIEYEFTRGTVAGAAISCVGAIVMLTLFVLEFHDFMQTKITSEVQMDDFEDSLLVINFNVTVERLPCPFLEIDIENVLGTHKLNLTQNIRKWKVKTKGNMQRRLTETTSTRRVIKIQDAPETTTLGHQLDGGESVVLTLDNYDDFIRSHDLVLVNFYAPWCMWSKKLLPVWQQAAQEVHNSRKLARGHSEGTLTADRTVAFAHVDCTAHNQVELCHRNHVSAFPTIITFKGGRTYTHEKYHGDRTVSALAAHVEWELPSVHKASDHPGEGEMQLTEQLESSKLESQGKLHKVAPAVEGCQVAGIVKVAKVPGSLNIAAVSPAHSFDPELLNMTHSIHHLSFGQRFSDYEVRLLPTQVANAMHKMENLNFASVTVNQTHEHYLKVVGTVFNYKGIGKLSTYKYTSHSAAYHSTSKFPQIKLQFDLSPMNVIVTETHKPLYHFITSLFAIIGGTFTVFGIADTLVHRTGVYWRRRKATLGKQY